MKKAFKPEKQIVAPVYPGGKKALDEFVSSKMVYPEAAISNQIEGTVAVDYDVDVFGRVISAKIKHGLGYGCDEEALRLTRLLAYPKKKYQGLHVIHHMHILIHFRLKPGNLPAQAPLQINYQVISKSTQPPAIGGYTVNL
jgi:TonB family protein